MTNSTITIKHTPLGTLAIYSNTNDLIATSEKKNGLYTICIYGGPKHGKVEYAKNKTELHDKSVSIAQLTA